MMPSTIFRWLKRSMPVVGDGLGELRRDHVLLRGSAAVARLGAVLEGSCRRRT